MPIAVKDLDGKVCFHIDGEFARDDAGSVIGQPGRQSIGAEQKLSFLASRWMSGRSAPSFSTKDEKPVLLDLAPTDLSTPSAQASFGLEDGECIADKVSPIRPTKHLQGIWYAETVGDATPLVTAEANLDGAPNLLSPSFTPTTFTTIGYALAVKLPVELIANADFDLKRRATRFLVEKLRLAREKRVAALLTTTANWAAGNRVAIPAKWNGGTTANPMADMFSALAVSALPANVIVLPEQIAQYFYQNANSTAMRDYVQSGGEMPKVLFARALQKSRKVLIADEPTRGVDVGSRRAIYDLIVDQAAQGSGVLVISSDGEEVLGLAHRILVIRAGRVVAELTGADMTEEKVLTAAFADPITSGSI